VRQPIPFGSRRWRFDESRFRRRSGRQPAGFAHLRPVVVRQLERPSDRFQIDTGYFRLSTDTSLRFNGAPGSGDINLEDDLGVDDNVDTFRNAGLGVQYKYNKYSYDRGILVSQLGGEITYKGFQVFLTFLF
jgi:hypothetical protein